MCKENLISMGTLIQLEMLGKFWNKKVEKVVDMIVKNQREVRKFKVLGMLKIKGGQFFIKINQVGRVGEY